MTKTSRLTLPVIAITSVAWLGVACGPKEEPEPEATATVAAETAPEPEDQPKWLQCMKNEDDCITGVRVQIGTKNNEQCQVFLKPWFSGSPTDIKVYSKGRVFFLVQWQEECEGMKVRLTHTEDQHPWEGRCQEEAWEPLDGKSFTSVPCEIREHSDNGPDQWTDYPFDLQIEMDTQSPADKTGGTVRVRGSGRPPANAAPAS